ncbi:hypothetical protein ABZX69_40005 [Streptomyces sp. NPDC004074]|uniref:hypothetical protein n=1 Tax=Streptomyces sp. NPDC004074 TaxID=3154277 RepID=UPI0033AC290F
MNAWSRAAYDLLTGAAMVAVACDVGDSARRLHRRVAGRPRVGAVLTPAVLRATAGALGAIGTTVGAVRLVSAAGG